MLKATFRKHTFIFKQPGGTSRGVLKTKDSWHIVLSDSANPGVYGIGECSIIPNLSIDDCREFEEKLKNTLKNICEHQNSPGEGLWDFPAIRFGLETALIDLKKNGRQILFTTKFTDGDHGIPINGLVWMGSYRFMKKQINEKIEAGYRCLKLKIGAINFEDELKLLRMIRKDFDAEQLELRVDANGAFKFTDALEKLKQLSDFNLHSIEQPIRQGQWDQMAELCGVTPLPIALDEELIGIHDEHIINTMLDKIKPQYIILKPSLLGGFKQSKVFIKSAQKHKIGWWVTSALEGNIGLNAIAQWTATLNNPMPQGLGTGQLFKNNIDSPLFIEDANLLFDAGKQWNLKPIIDG